MVAHAHGVITLPARDTVLGGLSDQGSRVELAVVSRRHDALGRCYAVHLVVDDVDAMAAAVALARLQARSACIVESRYDARARRWTASGWIPVQNVAPRIFSLLEQVPEGAAPAWVVMRNGLAQVRLRPQEGSMDGFLRRLADAVQANGAGELVVMDIEDGVHQAHAESLLHLPAPVMA